MNKDIFLCHNINQRDFAENLDNPLGQYSRILQEALEFCGGGKSNQRPNQASWEIFREKNRERIAQPKENNGKSDEEKAFLQHKQRFLELLAIPTNKASTEIPIVIAYNGQHFESLIPTSNEDIQKTVELVKAYKTGIYEIPSSLKDFFW